LETCKGAANARKVLDYGRGIVAQTARTDAPEIINRQLAQALAHPMRVRILAELNKRVMSPSEFVDEFGGSVSNTAYHFRKLEEYGCLEMVEEKPRRGAIEHYFQGTRRALFDDDAWHSLPEALKNSITGVTFQTYLERVAQAMEAGTMDAREERHLTWTALVLDQQAWDELIGGLNALFAKALDLQVEACLRMAESGEEPITATVGLAGFESPRSEDG
jgi:DNA-binding transcriptional ArsR family regulator